MKLKALIPPVILILGVLVTILPFFRQGLFDVHDPTSAFRLFTLIDTIQDCQFPAAWSNRLNYGFGYPLHLYYAPLFGYLSALVFPLVRSYEVAIKVVLALASLAGTFGTYRLLRGQSIYAGLLGALAFTFLPYRAGALYVRGSYAEFLAMSLLPWVIYFWLRPQNSKKTILKTGFVTALFLLSHNTLPVLAAPVILLIIVLFQRAYLKGVVASGLLSLGLSAWFLLPVLLERHFIQVDALSQITDFHDHYLGLSQLWYSPWGYGGSAPGTDQDLMSFMVGKGQLILGLTGLLWLVIRKRWKLLAVYLFLIVSAVFIALPWSRALWEQVSLLQVIQFPWRSLSLLGAGVAAAAGLAVLWLPKRLRLPAAIVLSALIIMTNYRYFRPQEYRDFHYANLSDPRNLAPLAEVRFPEYLPAAMPAFPRQFRQDGFTHTATSVTGYYAQNVPGTIPFAVAYMPQWQLWVDGDRQVPIAAAADGTIVSGELPAGAYSVSLIWERTTLERTGLILTLISLLGVIGLSL